MCQVRQVAGAAHMEPLPDQRQPSHTRHQRLRQLPHLLLHRDQVQRSANIFSPLTVLTLFTIYGLTSNTNVLIILFLPPMTELY